MTLVRHNVSRDTSKYSGVFRDVVIVAAKIAGK